MEEVSDIMRWQDLIDRLGVRMDAVPAPGNRALLGEARSSEKHWLCSFLSADGAKRVDIPFTTGGAGFKRPPAAGFVVASVVQDLALIQPPTDELAAFAAQIGQDGEGDGFAAVADTFESLKRVSVGLAHILGDVIFEAAAEIAAGRRSAA